jgi:hypothetical protein
VSDIGTISAVLASWTAVALVEGSRDSPVVPAHPRGVAALASGVALGLVVGLVVMGSFGTANSRPFPVSSLTALAAEINALPPLVCALRDPPKATVDVARSRVVVTFTATTGYAPAQIEDLASKDPRFSPKMLVIASYHPRNFGNSCALS